MLAAGDSSTHPPSLFALNFWTATTRRKIRSFSDAFIVIFRSRTLPASPMYTTYYYRAKSALMTTPVPPTPTFIRCGSIFDLFGE